MNRPLIMGVAGASAKIVEASGSGIQIEPENDQQLTEAVVKLCDSPDFYQQLCTQGRSFVTENYSREKLANDMLKTIERVAGKKGIEQ